MFPPSPAIPGLVYCKLVYGEKLQAAAETQPMVRATNRRSFSGNWGVAVKVFCVGAAAYFVLYNGLILQKLGLFITPVGNASAFLAVITTLGLLFYSARKRKTVVTNNLPWYDIILILAALAAYGYPTVFYDKWAWAVSTGVLPPVETALTFIAIITLLEASRRVMGWPLVIIAALAIIYLFLTEYAPGFLHLPNFSPSRIAWMIYAGEWGLFGFVTQVAATIIVMFVIFAAFLQRSAAGDFFINLAFGLLGHVRGGPAKAAVIASSVFGTFSGSPSGNVAATGAITIPLMKRVGYKPEFAGGVEAAASTGGNFMPPVMGTAAFVMADWLGIPYLSIAIAALVPALLYYLAIFIMVDAQAVKLDLRGLPRAELPKVWSVLKDGWYWFIPIIVIIITLAVFRYTPARSGFYALLSIIPLTFIKREKRFTPKIAAEASQTGMINMLPPAFACGLAGVFIGAIAMTGIGLKLSSTIVRFAAGNMVILLMLAAFVAFVLGMGLSSVAVYIIVAVLVAPALVQMGIPLLRSHLFVYYYGMISHVTPPVASASFVAAGLAESDPLRTGIWATRLSIVVLLIPFAIIYNPALILSGPAIDIIRSVPLAFAGTAAIAFGIGGYALTKVNWLQRILFIIGGFMMYLPNWDAYIPGILIICVALLWQIWQWRRVRTA